ncbi:MAG: hypothetical protein ACKO9Q_16575, partial [Pirellula sp.]
DERQNVYALPRFLMRRSHAEVLSRDHRLTDRGNRLGVKSCDPECGAGCPDECLEQVCSHG